MKVLEGHQKFKDNVVANSKDKLKELEQGQAPHTLLITCSDSRICPNLMTNTDFGELFVIRNAGNSIIQSGTVDGDADLATVEYAVKVLKIPEIVVCGHSHCGAVAAALGGVPKEELPHIHCYLERFEPLAGRELSGRDAEKANVRLQVENLLSHSFVKQAVEANELKVYGALYHIETGELEEVK